MRAWNNAYRFARQLAAQASLEMRRGIVDGFARRSRRDAADWVTDIDLKIEHFVRAQVESTFPGHAIVGEEYGRADDLGDYVWYIDSIDGSINCAHNLPWSCFSISLTKSGIPIVGVVATSYDASWLSTYHVTGSEDIDSPDIDTTTG
ncbi:inositol monophosphatase family protein [Alicyclobacillus acidiphilus]|uniref:inositol monophosphatase family protein n=1 Tax=Alicyclobacillus acidiphilus TaxID=182455 RepID=UPI00247FF761|nr:inositol monophosphatase family protein [Alicyclobacillus acidiphilus]